MESDVGSSDLLSLMIWGGLTLAWLGLTVLALRGLRRASGARRFGLFVLATLLVAVLFAPLWFFALFILADLASSSPDAGIGGGAALVPAGVMGLLVGLAVAGFSARRRGRTAA